MVVDIEDNAIARTDLQFLDIDQATANAKLIAAAPEMIDACHYALGFIQSWEKENGITKKTVVREALEVAIAKAS